MKVLVSAFKPFNNNKNNYAMEVIQYINNVDKVIVDVIYDECFKELSTIKDLNEYDLIIALGEARMRNELTLEKKAYNIASCSLADNNNVLRKDSIIIEDVSEELESEVNIEKVSDLVAFSTNPGRFVCNNLYFHLLANYPSKSLFIHIPECNNDVNNYIKYAKIIEKIIDRII